jgi:hypothetical protein
MEHSFDIDIAKEYGILEAVLLKNLWFWVEHNRANDINYHDGNYWTYNSTKAFTDLFPYATERQIKYALKRLREEDVIQVGNYNQMAYDRTLWYAFTEKGKSIMQRCPIDSTNLSDGSDTSVRPIPNINTDIKPNNKPNKSKRTFIPPTLEEVQEYCKERGNNVDAKKFYDYFTAGNWTDSKGNKVKNWKQKLITWEAHSNGKSQRNTIQEHDTDPQRRMGTYI